MVKGEERIIAWGRIYDFQPIEPIRGLACGGSRNRVRVLLLGLGGLLHLRLYSLNLAFCALTGRSMELQIEVFNVDFYL